MKYLISVILCITCISSYAAEKPIGEVLDKMEVSHLQLIASNLTMLFVNRQEAKARPEITFLKFYATTKHFLKAEITVAAPFKEVTKESCLTGIKAIKEGLFTDSFAGLILMASPLDLTYDQVTELADTTALEVTLVAVENKELRVSCH